MAYRYPRKATTEQLVNEAVQFLYRHAYIDHPYYVGMSGGKDSTVCAELLKIAHERYPKVIKYQLFYNFTGIDPPEMVRYIKRNYPECRFIKGKQTFWQKLRTAHPPTVKYRWCCQLLKKGNNKVMDPNMRKLVLGIRMEESPKRAKLGRIKNWQKKVTNYFPIYFWWEYQLWQFIEDYSISYCKLYDDPETTRTGCIVCPYNSFENNHHHHVANRERYPGYYKKFEKCVKESWEYHTTIRNKIMYFDSPEEYLEKWYHNSQVPWAIGQQTAPLRKRKAA
jgi:phosphoadenosine phosphosulfate reductase